MIEQSILQIPNLKKTRLKYFKGLKYAPINKHNPKTFRSLAIDTEIAQRNHPVEIKTEFAAKIKQISKSILQINNWGEKKHTGIYIEERARKNHYTRRKDQATIYYYIRLDQIQPNIILTMFQYKPTPRSLNLTIY